MINVAEKSFCPICLQEGKIVEVDEFIVGDEWDCRVCKENHDLDEVVKEHDVPTFILNMIETAKNTNDAWWKYLAHRGY
jgi:hypothetical protein